MYTLVTLVAVFLNYIDVLMMMMEVRTLTAPLYVDIIVERCTTYTNFAEMVLILFHVSISFFFFRFKMNYHSNSFGKCFTSNSPVKKFSKIF